MSDGCLAFFIGLVLALGAGILVIIWRTDDPPPEPPYTVGCLFGSEWPTNGEDRPPRRWPDDED